ncbi:unnamed protein product, partial [marine sediment metagenome]
MGKGNRGAVLETFIIIDGIDSIMDKFLENYESSEYVIIDEI